MSKMIQGNDMLTLKASRYRPFNCRIQDHNNSHPAQDFSCA